MNEKRTCDNPINMMQALRFHGQKDIRLDEVEIPQCGKGQVKVILVLRGLIAPDRL